MSHRETFSEDYEFSVGKTYGGGYSVSLPHQCDNWEILGADVDKDESNDGYKFTPEDWKQVLSQCTDYQGFIAASKDRVMEQIAQGKVDLLRKPKQKKLDLPPPKYEIDEQTRTARVVPATTLSKVPYDPNPQYK